MYNIYEYIENIYIHIYIDIISTNYIRSFRVHGYRGAKTLDKKYIAIGAVIVLIVAAVGVYALGGDDNANDESKPTVVISGSTTVLPVMNVVAEKYKDAKLNVTSGGSSAGAQNCIDGVNDIGMLSRDLKDSEKNAGLIPVVIAKDAVAVIVDKDAGVSNLTLEQIAKIYAGEITNWKDVGGADLKITCVVREAGSGTRDCFNEAISTKYKVDYDTIMAGYQSTNSNGNMAKAIDNGKGAIGYVGLSYISGLSDKVNIISVDGVQASVSATLDGTYEITRSLILVTKGAPSATEQSVIDFILSADGQKIVEEEGYVPII